MGASWEYHCSPDENDMPDEELIEIVFSKYSDSWESSQEANDCENCKHLEYYGCTFTDTTPPCFEVTV